MLLPARLLAACYLPWMAALTVAFYALPSWHMVIWVTIGLTSAVAIVVGIVRNRPRRSLPWLLQAMAVVAFCAGDTTYNVLTGVLGQSNPFPSLADLFYLICFPLLATGLLLLARSGASSRDWAGIVDTLLLSAGLGLLCWVVLIEPYVSNSALTLPEKLVSVAYPVFDVVLLATVIRLVVAVRPTATVALLAVGGTALLVADVIYGLGQLDLYGFGSLSGSWQGGGPSDLGWIVFYAAWGAAALHRSMAGLTDPRMPGPTQLTPRRLLLVAASSLVAPLLLLNEALRGPVADGTAIAVMSTVMFALVLVRLGGVVNTHRRALGREQALRTAGAALVSATDATEVEDAVRTAVRRLLRAGTEHTVVVVLADTGDPAASDPRGPGRRGSHLEYTAGLPEPVADQLLGFEVTMRCPMTVEERPSGGPEIGTLYIAAAERRLVGLEQSLDVLAAQAALALERVNLTGEIYRRRSEEYFRTLVQNTADVIVILDDDDRVRYASPSAGNVFGPMEMAGQYLPSLVHHDDRRGARDLLRALRSGEGYDRGASWRMVPSDGVLLEAEASFCDLRRDRTVSGIVVTLRDVTERRRLERELTHQAFYDSLTGLANRALFSERLQQATVRSVRTGCLVGVLFLDLDNFKVVNDSLGHTAGDALLVAVGRRLTEVVRAQDTVARVGGDEFAVVVEDVTGTSELDEIAERISVSLARPLTIGDRMVSGGASMGISTTAEAADASELLRQADLALTEAKGAGGGQRRRYQSALHAAMLERIALRADLEQAVAEGGFLLNYQPIVSLDSGETVGFEALVRWRHPTRGMVPPGEFIEVAEDSGLIVPIGTWVLGHAVATAAEWCRTAPGGHRPYVSVNVSARQFRTAGFADEVRRVLHESGLPPGQLLLEITESLLLRDDEQVWSDLTELRKLGLRVAIDDFGTGYSSLSYLRQVPIDVVKIDKSFIDAVGSSRQQWALVDGIVRLAQTLDLQVVAEGIERPEDRRSLVEMGCPYGQGYLFSKPLSYGDAVRWLLTERVAA